MAQDIEAPVPVTPLAPAAELPLPATLPLGAPEPVPSRPDAVPLVLPEAATAGDLLDPHAAVANANAPNAKRAAAPLCMNEMLSRNGGCYEADKVGNPRPG